MPRQARIDYPGALHHVIVRGIEGKYIFKEDYDKEELYSRLKDILEKSNLQIYAWGIMSNHFHLAIQTGKTGLSEFMRQLLTGYAINYNRRHKRRGYLFQNRYKSLVCDQDEYLLPLIRYIHLNPVKAKMITYGRLRNYKWTGHKELMEGKEKGLIERDEVLGFFGRAEGKAKSAYEEFVKEGLNQTIPRSSAAGFPSEEEFEKPWVSQVPDSIEIPRSSAARRFIIDEDFINGGLIKSRGGIKAVLMCDEKQMSDERILGNSEFVNNVLEQLEQIDEKKKYFKDLSDLIKKLSKYYKVSYEDILKTKTKEVRDARIALVYLANEYLGINATSVGKLMGISQAAASMLKKKGRKLLKDSDLIDNLHKV